MSQTPSYLRSGPLRDGALGSRRRRVSKNGGHYNLPAEWAWSPAPPAGPPRFLGAAGRTARTRNRIHAISIRHAQKPAVAAHRELPGMPRGRREHLARAWWIAPPALGRSARGARKLALRIRQRTDPALAAGQSIGVVAKDGLDRVSYGRDGMTGAGPLFRMRAIRTSSM